MIEETLHAHSRLMLWAPHPDDESLAAGVLLQKARAAGAAVRVVYATDGDDNPWPQRALEHKWRLQEADRKRWGRLRRREAIDALTSLGLSAAHARFLGLPDQLLTSLLLHDHGKTSARIGQMIADWAPSHLLGPSALDTHPDHSALALLLHFALASLRPRAFQHWTYLVHGRRSFFGRAAQELSQSTPEALEKHRAIACHKTQMKFSRRRFLAYAKRSELFLRDDRRGALATGAICCLHRVNGQLELRVRLSLKPLRVEETMLYLVGQNSDGAVVSCCLRLPARNARVQVTDCSSGHRVGMANYRGNAFYGLISFSVARFALDRPIFAKLNRRSWFFDESGWLEITPEKFSAVAEPFHFQPRAEVTTSSIR